jgi:hypothetical protein
MRRYILLMLLAALPLGGCGDTPEPGPAGQSPTGQPPGSVTSSDLGQTMSDSPASKPDDGAAAIIDKAIEAQGGEAMVAKLRTMRIKVKGKGAMAPGQADMAFTLEDTWQMPDKYKTVTSCELNGAPFVQSMVINGEQGWMGANGQTQPMPAMALTEMKEQKYAEDLDRLLSLKDGQYRLSTIAEVDVDGQPAVGVKITSEGHRDVRLYFDKSTGLLVKREQTILDDMGKLVPQEVIFTDYQDRDGVKHWMKIRALRDGKQTLEAEVVEIELLDTVDDNVFGKP